MVDDEGDAAEFENECEEQTQRRRHYREEEVKIWCGHSELLSASSTSYATVVGCNTYLLERTQCEKE